MAYDVNPDGLGDGGTILLMGDWSRRWVELMVQLVDEMETETAVGDLLGYGQSTISKWKLGSRDPSLPNVEQVCSKLGLSPAYFAVQSSAPVPYTDYVLKSHRGVAPIIPEALVEFTATEEWARLTPDQQLTLRRFRVVGSEPTVNTYRGLALLLQTTTDGTKEKRRGQTQTG